MFRSISSGIHARAKAPGLRQESIEVKHGNAIHFGAQHLNKGMLGVQSATQNHSVKVFQGSQGVGVGCGEIFDIDGSGVDLGYFSTVVNGIIVYTAIARCRFIVDVSDLVFFHYDIAFTHNILHCIYDYSDTVVVDGPDVVAGQTYQNIRLAQ
ncbi:MAG: hypothetical protein BWY95_01551 [Bacteroidetes bacterium ADurb.BinA104]|nr:MAG: hypothetical protein BWY95_01551 [Bacteroidetes bacterium ADurb.BinA104]